MSTLYSVSWRLRCLTVHDLYSSGYDWVFRLIVPLDWKLRHLMTRVQCLILYTLMRVFKV